MPRPITLERLQAMSLEERDRLYARAVALGTPEAKAVIALILDNDLLMRTGGGLPNHHPIILEIEEIIRSAQGRAAAKTAADGKPAMAGVDPLLQQALGSHYGSYDTTSWAGTFVADVMADHGYVQTAKRPMPEGSVAKTAAFFENGPDFVSSPGLPACGRRGCWRWGRSRFC